MQRKDIKEIILDYLRSNCNAPISAEDLLEALAGEFSATKFWNELLALEKDGRIVKTRFGTYGLPEKMGLVTGRLQLTSKGFGFVIPDNKGDRPDVFISPRMLNGAMNNDRVMARVNYDINGKKPEGEIIRVITRAHNKIVGTFFQSRDYAFVVPDDKKIASDIYIMRRDFNGAKNNQKVVVEITEWPQEHRKAEGKVVEILGKLGDVGLEILSIIKQNDLPLEFPTEVVEASKKVPKTVHKNELAGRRDLRHLPIVTIDGEDAKDLDDAVYVQQLSMDEFLLGVYIADVSYYVTEDSTLDKEARERGTSVYLVDRVLPMLPERLSNGICSLNAGVDRLSMACEMHINREGKVLDYEIFPAVIHVRHRLSYNIVREILAGDEALLAKYEDILPMVGLMDELREILHKKRARRGSIDFDLPEQRVILDEKLRPIEIVQRIHGNAESIIEEFMLAANETVAQHMFKQTWPFVYRVHDLPAEDKMQELAKLLANFNVKFKVSEEMEPAEIQRAVRAMEGRPEERLVSTVALRSMKQAVYQTDNIGHFGLAAKYYTHFTSPIRRYPDLIVHRLLREWMQNPVMPSAKAEPLTDKLDVIAEHSSLRERAAAEAERATVKLKMCEYMEEHIGEEFDGVVSGVTAFGMFVELPNGVEGLVHISSLMDDYYEFYEERYALVGTHTKNQYRLGDKVRIEVLQVNIQDVSIDFIMAGENAGVREHIRQQLLGRQSHSAAYGQKRSGGAAPSKAGNAQRKNKASNKAFVAKKSKGSKNKEASRRSAKHGKDKNSKKRRKKR
ncbi:MAG: ribonuclease R [Phascolarctobacterium sp.]|nr:ribonuclease R [Phascolarctobacterium sp.]